MPIKCPICGGPAVQPIMNVYCLDEYCGKPKEEEKATIPSIGKNYFYYSDPIPTPNPITDPYEDPLDWTWSDYDTD